MDAEDNRRLLGEDLAPVSPDKRKTQDIWALLVFLVIFLAYLTVCIQPIPNATPSRLQNGADWEDNFCGTLNSRFDYRDYPHLYVGDKASPKSSAVCIEKCPNPNMNDTRWQENANNYVCRFKSRNASLQEKKDLVKRGQCWLARQSRGYLGVCYSPTVQPLHIGGTSRGLYGDLFASRSVIVIGGVMATFTAYIWVSLCRLSARFAIFGGVAVLHLALIALIIISNTEGTQYMESIRSQTPVLDEQLAVAQSMITFSRVCIGVLLALFCGCIAVRNDLIRASVIITETSASQPPFLDLVPLFSAGLHISSLILLICGIASIATLSLRTSTQANSFMTISSEDKAKIAFASIAQLWLHGVIHYGTVFVGLASCSLVVFRTGNITPSVSSATACLFPSHFGTVAFASLILLPFEFIGAVVVRIALQLYTVFPIRFFSTGPLTSSAIFGTSYLASVDFHVSTMRGCDAHSLVVSANVVFFYITCMATSIAALVVWPVLSQRAMGDATISSIITPLMVTLVLATFVSRTIISVLSTSVEASVYCAAAEVASQPVNARSSTNIMNMISTKQIGGSNTRARVDAPANRITYDPRDKDQKTKRFVVEGGLAARDAAPDSARREAAALELAMGDGAVTKEKAEKSKKRAEEGINRAQAQMDELMARMGLDANKTQ